MNCELRLIHSASELEDSVINVLDIDALGATIDYGKKDKAMGRLAYHCLAKAVKDLNEENIDVLVTAPINKETIQSKHFSFMGHTDYLNENVERLSNDDGFRVSSCCALDRTSIAFQSYKLYQQGVG